MTDTKKNIEVFMKTLDDAWTFDRVEFEKSMVSRFKEGKYRLAAPWREEDFQLCPECKKNPIPGFLCDKCDPMEFEKSARAHFKTGVYRLHGTWDEYCTKCKTNPRPDWNFLCVGCREV